MSQDPQGPIIEPDPDGGYRKEPRVFLWAWGMLALIWAGFLYSFAPDWNSVMLGFGTGLAFAITAIEITGDKTPAWMKPPNSRDRPQWPPRP